MAIAYHPDSDKVQRSFDNYIENRGNPTVIMHRPLHIHELEGLRGREAPYIPSFPLSFFVSRPSNLIGTMSALGAAADEAYLESEFYTSLFRCTLAVISHKKSQKARSKVMGIMDTFYAGLSNWSIGRLYRALEDDTSRFHDVRNAFAVDSLRMADDAGVPLESFVSEQLKRARKIEE